MRTPTKRLPLVSVVVLNWNGKRFIDPFMKTLAAQSYPKDRIELLFTDNASSDDSVQYFQDKYGSLSNAIVVQNDKNYGYSRGNNLGIKQAKGDYILVCNNDLELDNELISQLVSTATETSGSLVVPKLMYLNRRGIINNAGSELHTDRDWPFQEIGKDQKDTGQYDEVREITAFCGACVLIKREFLEEIGLFDNHFFMYFEDGDLSWRGQRAGCTYYYAPKAVAFHVHTGSSKEGSPLFNHFVGRNRLIVLAKNAPYRVLARGWAVTLRDHLLLRLKRLWDSLFGRYPRRLALREFWLSQRMLWAALFMLPYAILKRYKLVKEETL